MKRIPPLLPPTDSRNDSSQPMKKTQIILTSAVAALMMTLPTEVASAQTCRVNTGVASNGARCYREVYEYDYVQDKPSFPGGDSKLVEFINKNRKYPTEAYKKGVQGRVTCSFVVNTDGQISNIKVLRSVAAPLNEEAIRIFSMMPPWIPGRHQGQCVPVRVIWSVPSRK